MVLGLAKLPMPGTILISVVYKFYLIDDSFLTCLTVCLVQISIQ